MNIRPCGQFLSGAVIAFAGIFYVACGGAEPDLEPSGAEILPGIEILGSGYDLTGNYADTADVKAAVLDVAALDADDLLRQIRYERATFRVVSGENSEEYQESLAAQVGIEGSRGAFSGALKGSFKKDR